MAIKFYLKKDLYGEFSNFSDHPIEMDGKRYPSSEHYFQSQKFEDEFYREKVRAAANPMTAARLGRSREVKLREDWEAIKLDVMQAAVRKKFTSYPELRELLLSTGDEVLIEAADGDYFWGCGKDGSGANWLGRILMEVRDELRAG